MKRYLLVVAAAVLLIGLGGTYVLQKAGTNDLPAVKKTIQDVGDFKIIYDAVDNPDYAELRQSLRESKSFEMIVEDLNKELALPVDIPIRFAECRSANAFYDPEKKEIRVCYELIEHLAQLFSAYLKSEEELEKAVMGATSFVLYHEIGHALVDVFRLPVTGREEDAVDQLATMVLIDSGEEGEEAALDGAMWFLLQGAQQTNIEDLTFWGEHSLDTQRFYNIACLVYGHDPGKRSDLVRQGLLPEERAERCGDEYRQLSGSWNVLLAPHLKK